jgi:EAL and modified HD-GYP domain-containing signal transduction protein
VFNVNPELSYSLLRFINSAAFFFRSEIRSISHAISLLGLKNLQNWLILLSYAGNKTQGIASPVFHAAASRAKLMELMTDKKYKSKDKRESAFLVGLLSFIDILYKRPIDELLQKLSIEKEIYNALMYFEGFYGQLLDICILENEQNFGEMTKKLENIGFSVDEFNNAKLESISWLNNLIRSL